MSFTYTSSFIQLTPYLLMEYRYAAPSNPETYPTNSVGFYKMENGHYGSQIQFFNQNINVDVTSNVLDRSVVKIAEEKYVSLDIDKIVPYNDFDPLLTNTADLPISFISYDNIVYDSVRLYVLSGYNLDDMDGIIFSIKYENQLSQNYTTACQIMYTKDNLFGFNYEPSPKLFGDKLYDKYIEVKVPNLQRLIYDYLGAASSESSLQNTLAYKTTSNGLGYMSGSPIIIELREIQSTISVSGYDTFLTVLKSEYALPVEDIFQDVNSTIQVSENGDFFEYFGTYQGNFIGEFIYFQNSIGNNYILYNDITVIEQIGVDFVETYSSTSIQTSNYDTPNKFRPVLEYSESAVSYLINYTLRLLNQKDNSSISRTSTITMNNPGSWGYKITPLQLSNSASPEIIYNKVINHVTEIVSTQEVLIQNIVKNITYPIFYETSQIYLDPNPGSSSVTGTINGANDLTIYISPSVENYFKFRIMKFPTSDIPASLYDYVYSMVFNDINGQIIKIPMYIDPQMTNVIKGEISFKIDVANTTKILASNRSSFFVIYDSTVITSIDQTKPIYGSEIKSDNKEYYTEGPGKGKFTGRILNSNGQIIIQNPQVGIIQYPGFPIQAPPTVTPSSVLYRGKWADGSGSKPRNTIRTSGDSIGVLPQYPIDAVTNTSSFTPVYNIGSSVVRNVLPEESKNVETVTSGASTIKTVDGKIVVEPK